MIAVTRTHRSPWVMSLMTLLYLFRDARRPILFLLVGFLFTAAAATPVEAKTVDNRRAEIRRVRDTVLEELRQFSPGTVERMMAAEGYAVFSTVGVKILVAGTVGGRGLLVRRQPGGRTKEIFMRTAGLGVGLGFGIKDIRTVFIFHDRAKLEDFVTRGWDFSGEVDATVKSDEKGGKLGDTANLLKGVEVIQLTKSGLVLQATVQGTKYWSDKKLN